MWWQPAADAVYADLNLGKKVVLRANLGPLTSEFVAYIVRRLGEYSLVVDKESDGSQLRERVTESVESAGGVAVVVPDFGALIRATWGPATHGALNSLCINSDLAPYVGALLVLAPSESIARLPFRGSPLADRHDRLCSVPVPTLTDLAEHLTTQGLGDEAAHRCAGTIGSLSVMFTRDELPRWTDNELQELTAIRAVAGLGPIEQERLLRLLCSGGLRLPYRVTDDSLTGLVHRDGQDIIPSGALTKLGAAAWLLGHDAGWPQNWITSARRLCCRITSRRVAYWVDRYLPDRFDRLLEFLSTLAPRLSPMELRLLSAGELDANRLEQLRNRRERWAARGFKLAWRRMAYDDYPRLHRRQVFGWNHVDGYTVPPVDRILCLETGGNEADAHSQAVMGAVVDEAWERATTWV